MTRPYRVLSPAARPVIAEWLQAKHRNWWGQHIPSLVIDAWMTTAEAGQFVLELESYYSVTGVPVTLNLQAYAVDGPEVDQ